MSVDPIRDIDRAVTLADIARAAGTSPSTASRALSGHGYVAEDVRKRLVAAADRLGYVPNASARTLKQQTSRVVGVVVSDLGNHFYGGLAAGIEQVLREAVQHLIELGHRRIALLGVDTDWTSDVGRVEGYRAAHLAAGLPVDEELIVRIGFHDPAAESRIDDLLARHHPTAVFAANNLLAEQAWRVIRARGLALPTDISLVGFDDVLWTAMVSPAITVVAQPTLDLGRRAASLLLRRIAEPASAPTVELLQPRLVVRGSSGPPRD